MDSAGTDVAEFAFWGLDDLPAGIAILIVVAVVAVFAIPLLLFIVEIALAILLVGVALAGRVLLRRPWTVEATSSEPEEVLRWKVVGWRRSGQIVEEIARVLEAGGRDFQSPYATSA
ncbi:MAG: hypothetical protein ACRDJI_01005 [Actinomycetota bacterium]